MSATDFISQILCSFDHYMALHRTKTTDYCVGVSDQPRIKMFGELGVCEEDGVWAYANAIRPGIARRLSSVLVEWGCEPVLGPPPDNATYVYIYLKSPVTHTGSAEFPAA